ncbi:MAG: shikimate kinase [Deltaproteobacteria bacterium]|nr:MAG: shikimate kinase [Deltaproteobacteria bacterium]
MRDSFAFKPWALDGPTAFFWRHTTAMNIILIGYRCTGKTSVGRRLAQRLGRPFVDTDEQVEKGAGRGIPDLVSMHGWPAFRKMETRLIQDLCRRDDLVISTGGGVVLDPRNVELLKRRGWVVWLQAGPEKIRRRMQEDGLRGHTRPGLTGKDPLGEIETVLRQRLSLYQGAAHHRVDTSFLGVEEVVDRIIMRAPLQGPGRSA